MSRPRSTWRMVWQIPAAGMCAPPARRRRAHARAPTPTGSAPEARTAAGRRPRRPRRLPGSLAADGLLERPLVALRGRGTPWSCQRFARRSRLPLRGPLCALNHRGQAGNLRGMEVRWLPCAFKQAPASRRTTRHGPRGAARAPPAPCGAAALAARAPHRAVHASQHRGGPLAVPPGQPLAAGSDGAGAAADAGLVDDRQPYRLARRGSVPRHRLGRLPA